MRKVEKIKYSLLSYWEGALSKSYDHILKHDIHCMINT